MIASTELAFRAQLVIPEQRDLYDYWRGLCDEEKLPSRSDIKPSDFPKLLPSISLVDVEDNGRFKVRLAGTRLRDFYAKELTGKYLDELGWGAKEAYWTSAYQRVIEACRPAQGIVRGPRHDNDHIVQFWLRLPLANDGLTVTMILCYDAFVPLAKASAITDNWDEPAVRYFDSA